MGTSVWYLIACLLLFILVNGETNDNSRSASEQTESLTPAPGRRLTGMKELVLYLTPEQAKVLEDAGAIVRPFPQFENAFLQQKLQQSVEEHTESQTLPTSTDEDVKTGVEHPDEFYKVINIQQLNEDLTVAAQTTGETTEKPRPKYKYVPKGRQQEYAATYVQKKNNKTKSYSTEYVRYLPNFEVENFKIEPYRTQPIPGYYYQDINSDPPTYFNTDVLDVQKPEEIQINKEVQQIQESQQPFEIQSHEENQKPVELQKFEEVQPPQEIYQSQDIQIPLNIQSFEYVKKSEQPAAAQKIEKVQQEEDTYKPQDIPISHNIQGFEYYPKLKRPVEIQKLEEVQPQEDIYKPQDNQRSHNLQRPEFIKKPKRPVEIQKLEEVQPQQQTFKPLDIQRRRNIQRLKFNQKSKRPQEIQKIEEVQRNENIHLPVEVQRPYKPVEIQKHEEVQRYEEIQRPLEIQTPYIPLKFQGHEEIQRPVNIQPFIEISTSTSVTEQARVQQPIESVEQIQSSLNNKGPVTFERKPQILEITRGSAILGQSDDIQTPLEYQTSLEDHVDINTGSLTEKQVETPYVSPTPSTDSSTATINDQFSSLLAPLVQHEKITESIARQTELVNSERVIQNKLRQLKDSGNVDGTKFKVELDKLNQNLGKQNVLSQKLALEAISKKQNLQISPKENLALKRPPLEIKGRVEVPVPSPGLRHVSPHVQFRVPRPYPVPLGIVRPIPVPVLQPENADLAKPVPTEREKLVPAPELRNVFVGFPFLGQGNYEFPVNYSIHQSDNLAVIRHIWDH